LWIWGRCSHIAAVLLIASAGAAAAAGGSGGGGSGSGSSGGGGAHVNDAPSSHSKRYAFKRQEHSS